MRHPHATYAIAKRNYTSFGQVLSFGHKLNFAKKKKKITNLNAQRKDIYLIPHKNENAEDDTKIK